jgi:hypothetical protein
MLTTKVAFNRYCLDKYRANPDVYPQAEYGNIGRKDEIWDAYTVLEGGKEKHITVKENEGAWINSVNNSVYPKLRSIYPDLNNRPANCQIRKCSHRNVTRLYAIATSNIPRFYEIIQNYNNDLLISE